MKKVVTFGEIMLRLATPVTKELYKHHAGAAVKRYFRLPGGDIPNECIQNWYTTT
ncbi:MAG: hypothetical protein LBD52_03505 [Prevotellaceae bacterium]|jgi:hypothetical protein|nr:hypothetical protein [Prevotellaceae bacterium]